MIFLKSFLLCDDRFVAVASFICVNYYTADKVGDDDQEEKEKSQQEKGLYVTFLCRFVLHSSQIN